MTTAPIPGANPGPPPFSAAEFDSEFAAMTGSSLLWRLAAQAAGDQHPGELEPWSDTTWWSLSRFVAGLRTGPGTTLADLACGRGDPGLWVARATGAQLVGIDWSAVAVQHASHRAASFLPAGRARFQVGTLEHTALPDCSVDGVMCADAFFFAGDRVAAAAEVARILRPGGHFVFTADERPAERPMDVADWTPILAEGGLSVVEKEEVPGFADRTERLYRLWVEHLDELRVELGDDIAESLRQEAEAVGPTLRARRQLIITATLPD